MTGPVEEVPSIYPDRRADNETSAPNGESQREINAQMNDHPPATGGSQGTTGDGGSARGVDPFNLDDSQYIHTGRNTFLYLVQELYPATSDINMLANNICATRNWDLKYVLNTRNLLLKDINEHLNRDIAGENVSLKLTSQRQTVRNAIRDIIEIVRLSNALSRGNLYYDHARGDGSFIINLTPIGFQFNELKEQMQQFMKITKDAVRERRYEEVESEMGIYEQSSMPEQRKVKSVRDANVAWDIEQPVTALMNSKTSNGLRPSKNSAPTRQRTITSMLKPQSKRSRAESECANEGDSRRSRTEKRSRSNSRANRNAFRPGQIDANKAKEATENGEQEGMIHVFPKHLKKRIAAVKLTLNEGYSLDNLKEFIAETCPTIQQFQYVYTPMETLNYRERCRFVIRAWPDSEETRLWDSKFWSNMFQVERWKFDDPAELDKIIPLSSNYICKYITGCAPGQTEAGIEKHIKQQYAHDFENKGAKVQIYKMRTSYAARDKAQQTGRPSVTNFVVKLSHTFQPDPFNRTKPDDRILEDFFRTKHRMGVRDWEGTFPWKGALNSNRFEPVELLE